MRFGIAIPVFGQAEFIGEALRSIALQRVGFQLAVMDATPDDSVQKVVQQYRSLVSYNRHGPDAGQSVAIQEGWDRTDAELLGWLCADDYYFPHTFSEVHQIFATRPDIDVVYGDTVFADRAGRFLGYFPWISEDISRITRSCCISQPSCFVRRTALERVGGLATDLHFAMDWDLWTRLYLDGAQFHYLRRPLSVCRMYGETKTASRSPQRYREIVSHLRTHAKPIGRFRSLFGFYYRDLLANRTSWVEQVAYSIIESAQNLKRWGAAKLGRKKTLYGIEKETNTVWENGEIWLPWFEQTQQCLVDFVVDRKITLSISTDDGHEYIGKSVPESMGYTVSVLVENLYDHLVRLQVHAVDSDKPWRIKTVELRLPSSPA